MRGATGGLSQYCPELFQALLARHLRLFLGMDKKPATSRTSPLANWHETVQGGKYVRILQQHVQRLREEHPHGNQELFCDDVVLAHLLAFFNPTLRSLRTMEDFSQSRQAQQHLTIRKLCKSTLSDFHRVCDPSLLKPLIEHLHAEATKKQCLPSDLPETLEHVLAVDGTFFALAADVAWAVRHGNNNGKKRASARLDVHLNVRTWLPEIIDVHSQDTSEAQNAVDHVQSGAIHIYDRGIFSFELLNAQLQAKAFFVHRLRQPEPRTPQFLVEKERPLTEADRQAGVLSDHTGRLAGSTHRQAPEALLREVIIANPDEPGGQVRLLTNLMEVEAHLLGLLYRQRWQIELFFRWLKVFANFDHLITQSRPGVLLAFYVAVIGVLLTYLFNGAKPSKYAFSLLSMVASGAATLEEITPILKERERQIALAKASTARRKAKKAD